MTLPSAFLDELRTRTPMPSLIGRYVQLTRNGRQWKGCCPFHNEKTPSFYVYDDHYHCFGCGAHGDAIGFVMQREKLDFTPAVVKLAREAGMTLPGASDAAPPTGASPSPAIENRSEFSAPQVDALLATAARLLIRDAKISAVSVLANTSGRLTLEHHDNWDGGQDTWLLTLFVPADVYLEMPQREAIEKDIGHALSTAVASLSDSDFFIAKIVTALEEDSEWRAKVMHHLSGAGITNQGRVRSDNIAARQFEGLLFRSAPEIEFYRALKRAGVPFAPLSVVLKGGVQYRRVEPDFILFKDGQIMIVEIDGDLYHNEKPAAAHTRLKFLLDEGAKLERITADECDTPEKAREAVERVLHTIEKHRRAR